MKASAKLSTPRGAINLHNQAMIKYKPLPPLERLNELLEIVEILPDKYGEWSGLIRKISRGNQRAGSVAGHAKPNLTNPGRVDWRIGIDGTEYVASRVIYYMTHGNDPGDIQVDHEDQNWLNNNAWNLRLDVNGSVQQVNSPMYRNNTSGVTGVSWYRPRKKWRARLWIKNKLTSLGYYTCKVDAARAIRDKWIELGWDKLGRELPNLNNIQCGCRKHF
jgi:hypothetical protein